MYAGDLMAQETAVAVSESDQQQRHQQKYLRATKANTRTESSSISVCNLCRIDPACPITYNHHVEDMKQYLPVMMILSLEFLPPGQNCH